MLIPTLFLVLEAGLFGCVQVNHDELLKTFMMIAKYAQLNFNKGIGSMCFMYGRLGYKKE